jgi:hypothetical protein
LLNDNVISSSEYLLVTQVDNQGKDIERLKYILESNLGVSQTSWTVDSAFDKTNELLKTYGNVKYSYNLEVRKFIDEICYQGLLSADECDDIRGYGPINLENNVNYVRNLLVQKKSGETNSETQTTSIKYTVQTALDKVNELITKYGGATKYGEREDVNAFVDNICSVKIISVTECIKTKGVYGLGSRDLDYLKAVLSQ